MTEPPGRRADPYLAQNLSGIESSCEHVHEEIVGFDHPFTGGANGNHLRAECDHRSGPVACGIRMSNATAYGSLVTYLNVANLSSALGQQRANFSQPVGSFQVIMSGHRSNANLSTFLSNVGEVVDAADVDQDLRCRQPKLHCRNQAVPACEYLCIVGMFGKQCDSFIDRLRRQVIKLCWNHLSLSCFQFTLLIIRQTFSGLMGMSRWRTPNGESASTMAPTIAGVAPIVPASPIPFTPSGFTGDGVSVRSSSIQGTIAALGMA